MKGIVFNLLAEITQREFGENMWDDLLEQAQLEGAYTSIGSYDDADLGKIVQAAATVLQRPPELVVQWFGRQALPMFAERYPQFFEGHNSTRSFLLSLNDIIHPEVEKLYPGAETPEFVFDEDPDGLLSMEYRSRRRMCAFAVGLIEGAAEYFNENVNNEHACGLTLARETCLFKLSFSPQES